jgi:adenosylhomocysteinase
VDARHFDTIKEGCILANLGHFDVEIVAKDLYDNAKVVRQIRPDVEEIELANGKRVILLAKGRLANLAISEGHPSEVMDMSFGLQALVGEYIVKNKEKFIGQKGIVKVPDDINDKVAFEKLDAMGIKCDKLTEEQYNYIHGFEEGT